MNLMQSTQILAQLYPENISPLLVVSLAIGVSALTLAYLRRQKKSASAKR